MDSKRRARGGDERDRARRDRTSGGESLAFGAGELVSAGVGAVVHERVGIAGAGRGEAGATVAEQGLPLSFWPAFLSYTTVCLGLSYLTTLGPTAARPFTALVVLATLALAIRLVRPRVRRARAALRPLPAALVASTSTVACLSLLVLSIVFWILPLGIEASDLGGGDGPGSPGGGPLGFAGAVLALLFPFAFLVLTLRLGAATLRRIGLAFLGLATLSSGAPRAEAFPMITTSATAAAAPTTTDWPGTSAFASRFLALDSRDRATRRAASEALQGGGVEAAEAALAVLASAPTRARRELATLVRREAGAEQVGAALAALAVEDAAVRAELVRLCARPDLGATAIEARASALERVAREDGDASLRRQAIDALGELDSDAAIAALGRLIDEAPPREAEAAARALPESSRSRALVRRLVLAGFAARPEDRTRDDILATLLPLHGRLLADVDGGGESARDRAPLVLGLDHPEPRVRAAANRGFERLLSRLRALGESERALRVLDGLGQSGLDRRVVHYHRARLAFYPGADPRAAIEAARRLRADSLPEVEGDAHFEDGLWRFRSLHLEAMGSWAIGDEAAALECFAGAASVLDALLAERRDLAADEGSRLRHIDALRQRALVALSTACCRLAGGATPREAFPDVRLAHWLSLEGQAAFAALVGDPSGSWDELLDSELSPFRLLFTEIEWPELTIARRLELQVELGRLMASVARTEMPGFAPFEELPEEWRDPLADPARRLLYERIQRGRLDALDEEIHQAQRRLLTKQANNPGRLAVEEQEALGDLLRARARLLREMSQWEATDYRELLELREPSSLALWIARDLRSEGRSTESRRLAERMRDDLEESAFFRSYFWGLERLAQIEVAIGNAYTDEDEPQRAEEELEKAVERLRGIEERLVELGAPRAQVESVRAMRSSALVGLAVNANVKLRDGEKALGYYEQAYELRQDDFMKVLLACYRARSGREAEARSLLRELRPRPQLFYNLACTHALLGDREEALEYLERELDENQASEAARDRQREWARQDPDLESLRGDPAFVRLVGEG